MSRKEERERAAEPYAYTNWQDDSYHEGASEGLPFDPIGHTEKTFIAGAEWADTHPRKGLVDINKVCEWLMLNADNYIWDGVEEHSSAMRHDFIDDFPIKVLLKRLNLCIIKLLVLQINLVKNVKLL